MVRARGLFLMTLLKIQDLIKTSLAKEHAPNHRDPTERSHYCPDDCQRIRVRLNEESLPVAIWERFDGQYSIQRVF